MEAKLASMNLKSPGLKSNLPGSPTTRGFAGSMNNFLSPDSASLAAGGNDPAATLAQQRAKLKATNAAHRISAPALGSAIGDRNTWGNGSSQLGQVDERSSSPGQELTIPSPSANSRPKSTDFSGAAGAFKSPRADLDNALSPMVGDSWASMVNTPLMPMFAKERNPNQSLDAAAAKLNDWATANGSGPGVPLMADPPKKLNRLSKGNSGLNPNDGMYNDDGMQQGQQGQRNVSGGYRNGNLGANGGGFSGQPGWNGARSPALSNTSGRFSDDGSMNGLGVGGFNVGMGAGLGMGMPSAQGFNMAALAGMGPISPFNNMFNMPNLAAMGVTPEQLLAMQMAAAGQLGQAGLGAFGMGMQGSPGGRGTRGNMRSPGGKSPSARGGGNGNGGDAKKDEEEVDPKLLDDVPGWLRSLRLHKYTPNFEGMYWKDMVVMDEDALEAKGVAALGARRKMLKTFEVVRKKMGIDAPGGAPSSA